MKKKAVTKVSSKVTPEVAYEKKIAELEAEVAKYHEWCLEWRRLNDKLEEELGRVQYMYCDAQAIIAYLESKLGA